MKEYKIDDILNGDYDFETKLIMAAYDNGLHIGLERKSEEIATNLLKCGCDIEFVHENTKLHLKKVEILKNNLLKETTDTRKDDNNG